MLYGHAIALIQLAMEHGTRNDAENEVYYLRRARAMIADRLDELAIELAMVAAEQAGGEGEA